MPKEIEQKPANFCEEIRCLRMSVSELMDVFEKIGLDSVEATSNSAEFDGLDDIKSAPARFSGEPSVQISKNFDGAIATASVEFGNQKTSVSGGSHKYSSYEKENSKLAKHIYEELKPFGRPWKWWVGWLAIIGVGNLAFYFIFDFFFSLGSMVEGNEKVETEGFELLLHAILMLVMFILFGIYFFLKREASVTYNPRETFWQKHGEAAIVFIATTVIAGIIITWLT